MRINSKLVANMISMTRCFGIKNDLNVMFFVGNEAVDASGDVGGGCDCRTKIHVEIGYDLNDSVYVVPSLARSVGNQIGGAHAYRIGLL